jgi:hypothetical protein
MHALDVRTRPNFQDLTTRAELENLGDHIQRRWPKLLDPVMLEWSDDPVVAFDRSGVPWVYGPVERDPMRGSRGTTVVPREQLAQLEAIAAWSVPFQRLAIAHEVDPEGPVRQLLPMPETGALVCSDEDARALVGAIPAHPGVARAVRLLDGAIRGSTSAVAAQVMDLVLDPIIFGVIAPTPLRHGRVCLWYPLVAWRW